MLSNTLMRKKDFLNKNVLMFWDPNPTIHIHVHVCVMSYQVTVRELQTETVKNSLNKEQAQTANLLGFLSQIVALFLNSKS